MSSIDASSAASTQTPQAATIDMKLEVVTVPVSDVDRAKRFYEQLGWRLDADIAVGQSFRVVQLTPPALGLLGPRSAIRMATNGCCKKSKRGFPAASGRADDGYRFAGAAAARDLRTPRSV
jgi:catechol 2,3-dioxygenase-like lactoylglutathione lyase family enzyme